MINLIMKNFMTIPEKLEAIALNKISPSSKDFHIFPEFSLIHYAAKFNNLVLFKQCISQGQSSSLQNHWKETSLQIALQSHSLDVIKYIVSEYKQDLNILADCYGHPLWWSAFEKGGVRLENDTRHLSFSELNYLEMISYLKEQKINFNQRAEKYYQENLACRLLQGYKHKILYTLLKEELIDVNEIARLDYKRTLAHCGSWMEDDRYSAMKRDSLNVENCYKTIYKQCNPNLVNENGNTVLDELCKSGRHHQVTLLLAAHKLELSTAQKLWLKGARRDLALSDFDQVKESNRNEVMSMVHFEVTPVGDMFYRGHKALISGLNDRDIKNKTTISLKDVISMEKIILPNGTELLKRV